MKNLTFYWTLITIVSLSLLMASCSKKDKVGQENATAVVIGSWKGQVTDANNKATAVTLDINADNTAQIASQAIQIPGIWNLNNSSFKADFEIQGIKANITADFSADQKTIEGVWSEDDNGKITTQNISLTKNYGTPRLAQKTTHWYGIRSGMQRSSKKVRRQ